MSREQVKLVQTIQIRLKKQSAKEMLISLVPALTKLLPEGEDFHADQWNLISWEARPGTRRMYHISFANIQHPELKLIAKIMILSRRLQKAISGETARITYIPPFEFLDKAIGLKNIMVTSTADFYDAEKLIVKSTDNPNARYKNAMKLAFVGRWLTRVFAFSITYCCKLTSVYMHGRRAEEEDREKKLLHIRIISELLAAFNRSDLSRKDRFYIAVFALLVVTGLRIKELATLPKKCLVKIGKHHAFVYYPEKGGKLAPRVIPDEAVPFVLKAFKYITEVTEAGRDIVKQLRKNSGSPLALDWIFILKDEKAVEYFVGRWAHEWTAKPENNLMNTSGAWWNEKKLYVDAISAIKQHGSKRAAARALGASQFNFRILEKAQKAVLAGRLPDNALGEERTDWSQDSRVITVKEFCRHTGRNFSGLSCRFEHIIRKAFECQSRGSVYPCPQYNEAIEKQYNRATLGLIKDKSGKVLLDAINALFVIRVDEFSEHRKPKEDRYTLLTDASFQTWLNRDRYAGHCADPVCQRLNIINPKTGKFARFTPHDVRHWLDTMYSEGGLDEEAIALIFGRKSKDQNHVYDQVSQKKRLESLRDAIRGGKVLNQIAEAYTKLAQESREEAEQYLMAETLQVAIMPHGKCTLTWRSKGCKNYMACFSKEGCCDYYSVDTDEESEREELERILRETKTTLTVMPAASPQYARHLIIKSNIERLLNKER